MPVAPFFFGISSLVIPFILHNTIEVVEIIDLLDIVYGRSFRHYYYLLNFAATSKSLFLTSSRGVQTLIVVFCSVAFNSVRHTHPFQVPP